jgi:2-phosphosulfolactate phosphatase
MPLSVSVELLPPPTVIQSGLDRGYVVIDTLRFTTTAIQALAAGANSLRAVAQIPKALALAAASPVGSSLLCGERYCLPIAGFDLGNSPLEYTTERVSGYDLIFTTTNGTKAIDSVGPFQECLLAALVNRSAVATRIINSGINHWTIVCAGTNGQVAGEDVLAAGAIIDMLIALRSSTDCLLGDQCLIAWMFWQQWISNPGSISDRVVDFSGARQLLEAGYQRDIVFACQIDSLLNVPACRTREMIFHSL